MKRVLLFFLLISSLGLFLIFSYNSGYGYDALEYLVIGRSLLDGYRLYDFIPSKSWGLYCLAAAFLSTGATNSHLLVAAITTMILLMVVCMTYGITRHTHGSGVALAASLLVVLSSVFMELNYLEPEGLVAACGLGAFFCVMRAEQNGRSTCYFPAGMFLGLGFAFKSVAGLYLPAALVFALVQELRGTSISAKRFFARVCFATAGFCAALILPILYFGLTGRLAQHLEWTYLFPFFDRPADTVWLSKLLTKLLWFDILVVVALAASLRRGVREQVFAHPGSVLALLMGLFSFAALFKQQASHYVFPGAVFFSIFIADVFQKMIPRDRLRSHPRATLAVVAALAVLAAGSAWLYSPRAFQRLTHLRNYTDEQALSQLIQKRVPADKNALFFKKSTLLYWISHRYPNIPFLKMDVQETYALKKAPGTLLRALKDPNLVLVECDPGWMGIQDAAFLADAENMKLVDEFLALLRERFELSDAASAPYLFWVRKANETDTR